MNEDWMVKPWLRDDIRPQDIYGAAKKDDYQKYISEMKELVKLSEGDQEAAHGMADELLCDFLRSKGYAELVEIYDKVNKWYS